MAGVALVLSGGGAKGAFQVMAEKYARQEKGYRWDIIAGVSVGALNASMLAMGKHQRLQEIWETISNDKVYTGKLNWWGVAKLVLGARSACGNKPLWDLIDRELEPAKVQGLLRVGAVSLRTGEYRFFTPDDPDFKKAVLASTVMPIVWAPVDVGPHRDMVDGGLRNISPLGDVLDADPDEVVIINCSPRKPSPSDASPQNALEIAKRSLDIAVNEIFVTDIREFIRINQNVQEAAAISEFIRINLNAQEAAPGLTLHNEKGKAFKYYRYQIIEPEQPLGDTLDFSQEAVRRSMDAGWEQAKKVLG